MPQRGVTGALTFELASAPAWGLKAGGLTVYWSVVVAVGAAGIASSSVRWLLIVAAALAVNGLAWVRGSPSLVTRVVLDGAIVTIVTGSETRVIPVAGITGIDLVPWFARMPGAWLSFDGGAAFMRDLGYFAPDRPVHVVQALLERRPDIPLSGRWSPSIPLGAPQQHYSPDRRWWWNGRQWLPLQSAATPQRRWGLIVLAGLLAWLVASAAIFGFWGWPSLAGDRELAQNAVETNATVTVDASTYEQHGAFCYSYQVAPGVSFSGCGQDEHDPAVTDPPVGETISIIYDSQRPEVSCMCTPDHLLYEQPVIDVFYAFAGAGILVVVVTLILVVPWSRIEAGLLSRRRRAVP
jgi:hypothetical protein